MDVESWCRKHNPPPHIEFKTLMDAFLSYLQLSYPITINKLYFQKNLKYTTNTHNCVILKNQIQYINFCVSKSAYRSNMWKYITKANFDTNSYIVLETYFIQTHLLVSL